jgi:hypothetical protein
MARGKRLVPAAAVEHWEARLHTALAAALSTQRASVHTVLGTQPGATRALAAASSGHKPAVASVVTSAIVWSDSGWRKAVAANLAPVASQVAREALDTAKAALPLDRTMGMPTSYVGTAQRMVDMAYSSGDAIGARVNAAAQGAANLADADADVDAAMDSAGDILDNVVGSMATGAANLSTSDVTSYLSGYFGNLYEGASKTWNSMEDDRVRPDHEDADGQEVALNDTFIVGGETMVGPHDPAASDAQTMGCRCFLSTDGVLPDDGTTSDLGDEDTDPGDVSETLDLGDDSG